MRRFILTILLAAGMFGSFGGIGFGQELVPPYSLPGSRLSPYLNFFRRDDPGVLDTYNAFVRPSLQLQQSMRLQNSQLRRLGSELQQLRAAPTRTTGVGGAFMNYSHFYSTPTSPLRR